MSKVDDDTRDEERAERRERLAGWLREGMEFSMLTGEAFAARAGVTLELVEGWLAGTEPMTLDDAVAVDAALRVPAGTTAGAGGYVSVEAQPDLGDAEVFSTREFTRQDELLESFEAAVVLQVGVRLRNQWETVGVDDRGVHTMQQRWVLELLTEAPTVELHG